MYRIKASIVIALLILSTEAKQRKVKCPEYCLCDVYENLRRAACQNKRLYSIEIDMPPQAEILDVSYNQISELGDKIFLEVGLTNLKLLNISHNKLGHIHLNGFEGLSKLKTLDISFNALRYFMESWFVSLSSLQELYLRGNLLRSINDEPRISLDKLKILDISMCGIINLTPHIFSKVPNLEILDISENFVTQLYLDVIIPLQKLTILDATQNNFHCKDFALVQLKNYTKNKGIKYKDSCVEMDVGITVNNKVHKFEKMILHPGVDESIERNVWIFEEHGNNLTEPLNAKIIEVCNNNKMNSTTEDHGFVMEVISMSPWLSVFVIFIFGISIGILIGCSVECKSKTKRQRRGTEHSYGNIESSISERCSSFTYSTLDRLDSRARSNSLNILTPKTKKNQEDVEVLMMSEYHLADSTPVPQRKQCV